MCPCIHADTHAYARRQVTRVFVAGAALQETTQPLADVLPTRDVPTVPDGQGMQDVAPGEDA